MVLNNDKKLRDELLAHLNSEHAHLSLLAAVKKFPKKLINSKAPGIPYTFWALLEHIRISQHDMIDFIQNPKYKYLVWPDDYWPAAEKKATKQMWDKTLKQYAADLEALKKLVKNPKTELLSPIPWGEGQSVMKEVIQIIDHNAYHTGAFLIMRRNLDAWK